MIKEFEVFFIQLNSLLQEKDSKLPYPSYNYHEFKEFFSTFSQCYQEYLASGEAIDIWQIAKIGNNEVKNCSVLAWFLNFYGTHGQKEIFLDAVLKSVLTVEERLSYNLIKGYTTKLEESHHEYEEENLLNRIDFVIESHEFIIFIEAKTISGIGYKQLERYSKLLNKIKGNRKAIFLYLAPNPLLPSDLTQLPIKPISISWRKISECIVDMINAQNELIEEHGRPLWQYCALQFSNHIKNF